MADKGIQMTQRNTTNDGWDNLFPLTKPENVVGDYGTATGTNTLVLTLSPAPSALSAGLTIRFKNTTANTGAVTLNINGLGAKSIVKDGGVALTSGNLKAGGVYTVCYDGVNFTLQGKGGDYGTAVATDVYTGKTIGTDTGLVTGTNPYKSGAIIKAMKDMVISTAGGAIEKRPTIPNSDNSRGVVVGKNNLVYVIKDYSDQRLLIMDLELNLISDNLLTSQGTPVSPLAIDGANNIYFGSSAGKVVKVNTATKAIDFGLPYNDTSYTPKEVCIDDNGYLWVAISGNLSNKNLVRLTQTGGELLSISSVMLSGQCVTTDAALNVYYGGYGDSGSPNSLTLMSYTTGGSLRWQKKYSEIPGVTKVFFNRRTNTLYALSNTTIYKVNPTTGAVISTTNIIDLVSAYMDKDDFTLYVKRNSGAGDYIALDDYFNQVWSTGTLPSYSSMGAYPYNDSLYFTLFDNSSQNFIFKVSRYTKYTLN